MTAHTFRFFRFLFCLFFATISFLSPARISAYESGVREALNAAAAPFFGFYFLFLRRPLTLLDSKFDVAGVVTDVNGKKLNDVSIVLFFSRPKDSWGTESEGFSETIHADGDFHIEKRWYTSMRATFHKDGYYSESFMFYRDSKRKDQSPVQECFSVKMREMGTLANMFNVAGRVKYDFESGNLSLCDLTGLPDKKTSIEAVSPGEFPLAIKKYLFLDFKRDENNNIICKNHKIRGVPEPVPGSFLLNFVSPDPDDGFIPVEKPIQDITYLTEAPKIGYNAKKLVIPYKDEDCRYYFYIRCGNFYGKGVVSCISAIHNEHNHYCSLYVEIFLNRKAGDTNLRSRMTY